ncbi:PREDICTED: transcription termination factor MTERF2, chloroplastic [Nicotiana attenuata]|uniref:Transcription termination factor mterf2, chloroplastic n=1 Tax=Nicotiana attenuata TaxID=49451 RepID=A0A1J6IPP1_NICAT|nr:PREDICTED: transcription termination factor MTERF2, chloroplastic [Nicotiana attenuata]OIT07141.1 transcription termination factor mterf2, chloroplastic [Nicotiana attenuata]
MLCELHHHHFSFTAQSINQHQTTQHTIIHFSPKKHRLFPIFSTHHPNQQPHHLKNQESDTNTSTTLNNEKGITRKHNSKSAAVLLRYLSSNDNKPEAYQEPVPGSAEPEKQECAVLEEDKEKVLEMSLIRKRTPQFPGSIYVQSNISSFFDLKKGSGFNDDDDEMLIKALEIRRKVTVEIFKEAMRKGRFGITYSTNLVSYLDVFIDYVMIQAASMKQMPEFLDSSFNVRARAFIDESGVVPIVRWLKHNALSYPQIANLICKSRGDLESIRRLAEWLKSIHVKGRFIGLVMIRAKENVLGRSLEELDEIVEYLENKGVKRDWIGYIVGRCPEILSFTTEELECRTKFYFDMEMDEKDFGTMVFDYPKVLGYFSMEEMNQKVAYLKEFGLSNEDVGRLLAFKPHLMGCGIEEKFKPLVKYFYYLGISKDGMRRILVTRPVLFCVDFENTIVTKVQFLRDIGVQQDAIGNVLVRFPRLLTFSLHKKIRPVVIFLLTKAGVSQKNIGKVIALGPELLGCSIANKLDHNVKYFLSLGITLRQLGEMVADFPMLLTYNIDILRPKYRYLRRMMVRPLQDLIEFPRFFSYSLDERIVPRHKIMVENRINFKLRYMLASTDDEFKQRVQAAVERRLRFESGVIYDKQADTQIDCSIEKLPFDFQTAEILEENTDLSSDYKDLPTAHIQNSA